MSLAANINILLAALVAIPLTVLLIDISDAYRHTGRWLPAAAVMNGRAVLRTVLRAADIEMELQLTAGFTGERI